MLILLLYSKILTCSIHCQNWPKVAGRHWTFQSLLSTLSNRLAAEDMNLDILRDEISFVAGVTDEEHSAASTPSLS